MKRKTDNFNKFYNKKRNSAVKEEIRQEKKAEKKERKEAIERHFEKKRQAREAQQAQPTDHPRSKFGRPGKSAGADAEASAGKGATPSEVTTGEQLPLNKYIAHSGICSRRDAAELIRQGKVTVNGKAVTEPGTKVIATDMVKVNGKKITISKNFAYILLNKPKDYITTTDDPQGRKTVLDLIRNATPERVYPVGRLDRNTSGVLLLTNDGDLAQKLAHPSHEIKKIYHVSLDKPLTKADFDKIINDDVKLEDGVAHVDVLAYADSKDKTQIGIEIHSGKNRIVRRIFEHLGYDVRGLDRVTYAGLTKKNVQRGKWRFLTEKEIRILKYLNSSIKGSSARAKEWAAANEIEANEKPAKAAKAERPAKRPALKDSFDRDDRPARGERPEREERSFDRAPKSDRAERSERPSKRPIDKAQRPRKSDRDMDGFEHTERPARPFGKRPASKGFDRSDRDSKRPAAKGGFDRAPKSDRSDRGSKRPASKGSDRPARGERSFDRTPKSERPARPTDRGSKRPAAGDRNFDRSDKRHASKSNLDRSGSKRSIAAKKNSRPSRRKED